jgi:glucose-6-phosphate dehydrogenase assembly protein OpcA
VAAAVNVDLTDTTAAEVSAALVHARHRAGLPAIGMVLTFVIVTDESSQHDALRAAQETTREHPSRIVVLVARPGKGAPRLDADVRLLGDGGAGETVVLRLHHDLSAHAESVALPLLLPDAPVVVWWPGPAPAVPADDPVGRLARRRVTDCASEADPLAALAARAAAYRPGDTDLAWTRVTHWRSLLAAVFDQPVPAVTRGSVACAPGSPSAALLAGWLSLRLGVPVVVEDSSGPGITEVRLASVEGDLVVDRPDGRSATVCVPGRPERRQPLIARETAEIVAEELRRLDPDDVYGEVLLGRRP